MPRTGSNIYKRKDGRWEGRFPKSRNNSGKIVYGYVYAKSCTEVKQRLNTACNKQSNESQRKGTLAEIANEWLTVVSSRVKPSTLASYEARQAAFSIFFQTVSIPRRQPP